MRLSVGSLRQEVKRDLSIEFVPQQLTSYGGLELLRPSVPMIVRHRLTRNYCRGWRRVSQGWRVPGSQMRGGGRARARRRRSERLMARSART
jgi:hypothetical protein